jgi:hypothetical protein
LPDNGTYIIEVTTLDSNAVGSYSLTFVSVDTDGDSIPDQIEAGEGRNPLVKDNDIFNSARLFVMEQYRDFFSREADPGGITYWTGVLGQGAGRAHVIDNFFNSPEFQGTIAPIARLYFAYFLRVPDYGGILFWSDALRSGQPLHAISENFALSAEFQQRYGSLSNRDFVILVYQNVLGRTPVETEIEYWKGHLDAGRTTRGQVMLGFSESDEHKAKIYNKVYVTMMYAGMLRRGLLQAELDYWINLMNQGITGLQLIENFLPQAEYRNRFLPPQQ